MDFMSPTLKEGAGDLLYYRDICVYKKDYKRIKCKCQQYSYEYFDEINWNTIQFYFFLIFLFFNVFIINFESNDKLIIISNEI